MRRLLAAATAAASLALVLSTGASAAGPYVSGTTGYDVSYPQCGVTVTGTFGVIGVNGGRPFSQNPCLAGEYATSSSGGAYLNTGYARTYAKRITTDCQTRSAGYVGSSAQQQAYAIGCSEAQYSESYTAGQGVVPPVWWLDVETANSWSTSNLTLNQATIQGLADTLEGTGAWVGVYSTGSQWGQIAGAGWTPAGISATWVAGASASTAAGYCSRSFTTAPVWLVQYVATYDQDYAC
ncbi:MAG TPA: hypothetical protein VF134_00160 [Candidatus Dormibacteraeota bacterium]